MKKTHILILTLVCMSFSTYVLAEKNNMDSNDSATETSELILQEKEMSYGAKGSFESNLREAEFVYSDYEVLNLLNTIEAEVSTDDSSKKVSLASARFNGMRVKAPNSHGVYVVENGKKRHIPNAHTYNNLFRSWNGIHESMYVVDIPTGRPIQSGAHLIKGGTHHVYISDHGKKRHIVNPRVFNRYHFNWKKIWRYPQVIINSIPTGPAWR